MKNQIEWKDYEDELFNKIFFKFKSQILVFQDNELIPFGIKKNYLMCNFIFCFKEATWRPKWSFCYYSGVFNLNTDYIRIIFSNLFTINSFRKSTKYLNRHQRGKFYHFKWIGKEVQQNISLDDLKLQQQCNSTTTYSN